MKESIIIYLIKENNNYKVDMFNTMIGIIENIFEIETIENVNNIINLFQEEEKMIKKKSILETVERYILNLIKI